MGKTLDEAIKAIQDVAGALPGIRSAPDYAPDLAPPAPFVVTVESHGSWGRQADWKSGQHTLVCLILTPEKNMASDEKLLRPYGERFANALLWDPTFAATVDNMSDLRYTFVDGFAYNGKNHMGWRFEVDITQSTAVTSP